MSAPTYPVDWRFNLDIRDRGVLKPLLEGELEQVGNDLVYAIHLANCLGSTAPEHAYILARRAHRYARILEVIS